MADSVPIDRALGYAALLKGLIYSEENLDTIENDLSSIDELSQLQEAVEKIEVEGLNAEIYGGKTAAEWADYLIELAQQSLADEDKEYLENVRAFWSYSK